MADSMKRPTAVSLIGYAALFLGLLSCGGGVALAREAGDMLERAVASVQFVFGVLLVTGAWALLHLRKWGSVMVQAGAILLLVGLILFEVVFLSGALHFVRVGMPGSTLMVGVGVSVMLVYALPLLLTLRTLRKASIRALLI